VTPRELANSICESLQSKGNQALLVGGCVRDLLLGREPADYDVTTNAKPDEVLEMFPEAIGVGAQFGVVLVPRNGMKVEVATFRSDIGYSDGRHPDSVKYTSSAEEDVQRRDLAAFQKLTAEGSLSTVVVPPPGRSTEEPAPAH